VRHPGELRWETRLLAVLTLTLTALGIAVCYSAGTYSPQWNTEVRQQLSGALIGGVAFLVAARLDYRIYRRLARPMFYATVAGLAVIALVGLIWRGEAAPGVIETVVPVRNNARRWLQFQGMTLQVSEVARFTLAVMVATLAAEMGTRVRRFRDGFVPLMIPVALVVGLTVIEPSLSMAILLGVAGASIAFAAGARVGHLLLVGVTGVVGVAALIFTSQERLERYGAFLRPVLECAADDQVCESIIGLGNGGLAGVGFGRGSLKLGHVPFGYADYILSVVGEEWGFIGVVLLAMCFALFCGMGYRIARTTTDPFGRALAVGLTTMVAVAALMHAAVVMSMMPATGITLPFLSVGRVSLVVYLLSAGVLVSIGRRRGKAR
jgi:cell division protein FtsW